MKYGSLYGREDGEHNDVAFVGIYKIIQTQDVFRFGTEQFERL